MSKMQDKDAARGVPVCGWFTRAEMLREVPQAQSATKEVYPA
jgi:hypothetical protein